MQWELGDAAVGNLVLQGKDFYISYINFKTKNILVVEETAICSEDKYYILRGDHREAYSKRITQGFEACLDYYHNSDKENENA